MKTLFAAVVHLGILRTCLAKCYYPGGKEATQDVPCDPDAEVSPCCGGTSQLGFACLSNKLCLSPKGFLARGSCSDPTWNSPDCPKYCMSETGKGWDLIACSNFSQTSFCCDGEAGCCESGHGRFDINPGQPAYTWALFDSTKSVFVVQTPLTTSTPSSTTSSSITSTTDSAHSSGPSTTRTGDSSQATAGPSPWTTGPRAPAETGTQGQSAAEQQSSGLSTGAQAGIGVGAAAGALLIAAVAYLLWKLRRIQAAAAAAAAAGSQAGWHEAYPHPPAPSYYAQSVAPKHELAGERETHELQGHSYYVQGDARSTEMSTHSPYSAVDSPLTTHQGVGR